MDMLPPSASLDGSSKPRILIGVAGGGFLLETQALLAKLGDRYEWHYAVSADVVWKARQMGLEDARIHSIAVATTLSQRKRWRRVIGVSKGIWDAWRAMRHVRPAYVVSIGSSISIPLFVAGRLCGARAIFIESMARVDRLSLTGRLICRFGLAHRFYVQWPGMADETRKLLYRGMVL